MVLLEDITVPVHVRVHTNGCTVSEDQESHSNTVALPSTAIADEHVALLLPMVANATQARRESQDSM